MDAQDILKAISAELSDIATRLARLQDLPLLQSPNEPVADADLLAAMVGAQDVDRLAQDVEALSQLCRIVSGQDGVGPGCLSALDEMPLQSLAERLRGYLSQSARGDAVRFGLRGAEASTKAQIRHP